MAVTNGISLFADGREWVASTKELAFAELKGVWPFDWIISDLEPPREYFSEAVYPKAYGWRHRFKAALNAARTRGPKPVPLGSEDAVRTVLYAGPSDSGLAVDPKDPLGLQEGATVELLPTDGGGYGDKDKGRLVKLTKDEVAIAVSAKTGEDRRTVHIHAPRWQFRIQKVAADTKL
ncbi:hypothetical protein LTR08_002377 [Meristemomyces frigidus]|nr:hypothetical protein LTR08_002377 [Meristemomyces frigidus]